jgi:pantetheine-phosphate adenylyltransferase
MSYITGIYPGTFDPITNGHADIIIRASKIVDRLILAVSTAYSKKPIFSIQERCRMVELYIEKYDLSSKVEVMNFDGLLVDFAKSVNASIIIRGLRAVSDFEYEFQMACMNSRLNDKIETLFLPASEQTQFTSSRLVKEIASLGGEISAFVLPEIAIKVLGYYGKN